MNIARGLNTLLTRGALASARLKNPWYRLIFKQFGKRSVLRKPLLISHPEYISVGNSVLIRDHARLEVVLDGSGRIPVMSFGDGTSIEQNCHIVTHCRLQIGRNVTIAPNVAIVDTTHPYEGLKDGLSACTQLDTTESFIEIGEGAFLGAGCVVLPNVRIGRNAVIGANSVVRSSVPDYCVAVGCPARVVKSHAPAATSQCD